MQWKGVVRIILDLVMTKTGKDISFLYVYSMVHFTFVQEIVERLLLRTFCKVIRIGKRVQPDISKARQQVNIDRPAYNKTDKQCRTRTTITARLPDG